jgi:hypothetical protein
MNKFQAHINPTRTLELVRENGEKDVFTIHPLPFKFLPKIFELLEVFQNASKEQLQDDVESFFKTFKPKTIELIQELVLESLKVSYPESSLNDLEGFARSNLFSILPVVIEVNSFNNDMNNVETIKKGKTLDNVNG